MVHTIRLYQKFDFNYARPSWHLGQPNDSLGLNKSKGFVWAKAFFHKSAGMVEIRLYTENQLIAWVKSNA